MNKSHWFIALSLILHNTYIHAQHKPLPLKQSVRYATVTQKRSTSQKDIRNSNSPIIKKTPSTESTSQQLQETRNKNPITSNKLWSESNNPLFTWCEKIHTIRQQERGQAQNAVAKTLQSPTSK